MKYKVEIVSLEHRSNPLSISAHWKPIFMAPVGAHMAVMCEAHDDVDIRERIDAIEEKLKEQYPGTSTPYRDIPNGLVADLKAELSRLMNQLAPPAPPLPAPPSWV